MTQTTLSRASGLDVVRPVSTDDAKICCPDCRSDVAYTKGGQRIGDLLTHGWECSACRNVIPCRSDADASTFVDGWTGVEVTFRDGEDRYVPVPERTLDGGE